MPFDLALREFDDEPRALDLDIAEALEYEKPRAIRELIERHAETLAEFGEICRNLRQNPAGTGRPLAENWLNEAQAVYLCAKSTTARAAMITVEMVKVFTAWRNGRLGDLPPRTPIPPDIDDANQRDRDFWLSTVREARLLSGTSAAKRIWAQSPLPSLDDGQGAGTMDLSGGLERFIDAECEVTGHPHDTVTVRELIAAYQAWCVVAGHGPINDATVARRLAVLAGQWRDPTTGRGFAKSKASVTIYRGIRLRAA